MNRTVYLGFLIFSMASAGAPTAGDPVSKLDPALRLRLDRQAAGLSKAMDETLDVFIQTDHPSALSPFGVRVRSAGGGWATADVPLGVLAELSAFQEVTAVRESKPCGLLLDRSIHEIRADQVHQIQGLRGKGVIIGIIDSGIDWTHPDFLNPDGTSRILYLWDQTDNSGSPPSEYASSYRHTTEYTQSDLNNELAGLTVNRIHSRDTDGHGTHVAGIAAGNGRGTGRGQPAGNYAGMAPEADLIIVKTNQFTTEIADGIDYIFRRAETRGQPAAINISLGNHQGGHDGTDPLEERIDAALGGKKGRFVAVAAGNDGDNPIHAKAVSSDFTGGNLWTTRVDVIDNPAGILDRFQLIAYGPAASNFSITVVTPNGTRIGPVTVGNSQFWPNVLQSMVWADNASSMNASTHDREILVQISDVTKLAGVEDFPTGTWTFEFRGNPGRIDCWLSSSQIQAVFPKPDYSTLVTIPGNAVQCLTVASYVSRVQWPSLAGTMVDPSSTLGDIAQSSSPGPVRPTSLNPTPLNKPEIAAPGTIVLSTLSQWMTPDPPSDLTAPDGKHVAEGGTSMASPHIAGLAALMLQADPTLTGAKIKSWIQQSANKDGFTGSSWSAKWGYGKADAEAALLKVSVESTPSVSIPTRFEISNHPNPFNASTWIEWSIPVDRHAELEIFDMFGRVVKRWTKLSNAAGTSRLLWDGKDGFGRSLPSGLYVARMLSSETVRSTKMVLIK